MDSLKQRENTDRKYFVFALKIMGEFTYIIAAPVVLLALLGKWLDHRFNTAPKLLIIGFAVAAIISGFTIWRRAKEIGREYQNLDKKIKPDF